MSGFSFRRRDSQSPEPGSAPPATRDEGVADAAQTPTVQHIAEYSSPVDDHASEVHEDTAGAHAGATSESTDRVGSGDAGLGTRIETIVTAAEQAAAQIRQDAEAEAARIREEAASARTDADRAIAGAEERARRVREDAETYAETRRREADQQAVAIVARAEEQVGTLESEANERRHAAAAEAKRSAENVLQLVTMCRDLADDLETIGRALQEALPDGAGRDGRAATAQGREPAPAGAAQEFSRSRPYE